MDNNKETRMKELSKKRLKNDKHILHEALADFADILSPVELDRAYGNFATNSLYDAFSLVCKATGITAVPIYGVREDKSRDIEYLAKLSNINYREILLSGHWWTKDNGPILAYHKGDNRPIALIPKSPTKYTVYDVERQTREKLSGEFAEMLEPYAVMFYKPFPNKKMSSKDILKFAMESSWKWDLVNESLLAFIGALIGMIVPLATQQVFDVYIPGHDASQLAQIGAILVGFLVGKAILELANNINVLRVSGKMESSLQNAIWDRLLKLPAVFFRDYTAGELASRSFGIMEIRELLSETVSTSIMSLVFSVVYLFQIFYYGRIELTMYAVAMVAVLMIFSAIVLKIMVRYERERLKSTNKTSGLVLQLIQGISKFRIAGAESRAFKQWANMYANTCRINACKENMATVISLLTTTAPLVFNLVFYSIMVKNDMDLNIGEFIAFLTAFGLFSSSMISLIDVVGQISAIKPIYGMIKPIIETLPESDEKKAEPGILSGAIRLENLSFRYAQDTPPVLKDITLEIKQGEYVGIVGPSGSGKSTLLRMLVGFETPDAGQIYYDNKDLHEMNLRSVRRQLGVVMQNAQLLSGNIYSNIVSENTKLTREDVMEAIKMVGMEEELNEMPMGLDTIISEGAATISGGQKQRLLIARAIINKPRILYFDEATSALDNMTQKMVQKSLDNLDSTRIVIAHRISTIMNCDRIIVLDKGSIVEEGTFTELMKADGVFSKLAGRQLI